jgi:hypothetical protein
LAKVKDSFELFKGDQVDSYLLFTNPHKYGWSIDVRFTPVRVVCNNTLTLSLNSQSSKIVKVSHRREFDGDVVKETLGVAKEKLAKYKEMAASKKDLSKNAGIALEIMDQQPGAEYGEGSWWQAFNAVTFMTDHMIGRNADNRMTSAWYGSNKNLKTKALETAVEFAEAA